MAIATLLRPPQSDQDWELWAFQHRDQHDIMRQAVLQQFNVNLPDYQLYPLDRKNLGFWFDQNQQAHDDMNAVLATPSTNLQQSNFDNPAELQSWIWLHFQEHQTWSDTLKVS